VLGFRPWPRVPVLFRKGLCRLKPVPVPVDVDVDVDVGINTSLGCTLAGTGKGANIKDNIKQ